MARQTNVVDVLVVLNPILEHIDLSDLARRARNAAQAWQLVDGLHQLDDELSYQVHPYQHFPSHARIERAPTSSAWTLPKHL